MQCTRNLSGSSSLTRRRKRDRLALPMHGHGEDSPRERSSRSGSASSADRAALAMPSHSGKSARQPLMLQSQSSDDSTGLDAAGTDGSPSVDWSTRAPVPAGEPLSGLDRIAGQPSVQQRGARHYSVQAVRSLQPCATWLWCRTPLSLMTMRQGPQTRQYTGASWALRGKPSACVWRRATARTACGAQPLPRSQRTGLCGTSHSRCGMSCRITGRCRSPSGGCPVVANAVTLPPSGYIVRHASKHAVLPCGFRAVANIS